MGAFNASKLKLSIGFMESNSLVYKVVSKQTTSTLQLETAEIDTTSKDSEGWSESIPGLKNGTFQMNARVDVGVDDPATIGFEELFNLWDGRTILPMKLSGSGINGKTVTFSFDGWVRTNSVQVDMETAAEVSAEVKVTGNVEVTEV